jgi:DNA recombination protein RmuC
MPVEIIFLLVGAILGGLIGWFIAKSRVGASGGSGGEKTQIAELQAKLEVRDQNLEEKNLEKEELKKSLDEERRDIENLLQKLAASESDHKHLELRLAEKQKEMEESHKRLAMEFENLANKILDEKSKKFTDLNKTNLGDLLNPLKERIEKFEEKVEKSSKESVQWNTALKEQISSFKDLGLQMTRDAEGLTKALKGDSKAQGNWGEMQLEVILQKAGLQKGIHYEKETSLKNEEGANQRLDFIIKLPEDRCLVLDSKVSLTAYANFFNAEEEDQKSKFLKQHIDSINTHIKTLGERNYQNLYNINQPDYVLMFVANEPALAIALQNDDKLYNKALEKNIALASSTFLLATLRMISFIWKQDLQSKNSQLIARQAGDLLDKFIGFTDDLSKLGTNLTRTQDAYHDAMNKLSEGKGNLIRRAENLKELGVKSTKKIDQKLLDRAEEN